MSAATIEVQGLSKQYWLGGSRRATSLRDEIAALVRRPFGAAEGTPFWALHDMTFAVAQGEIVGICGRNGAGKSTLLRILSRVTQPTLGRAVLRGRVSSLLEVGTGFHGELTGRENVFLNGTLLGMKRRQVVARLDEIVAFAGVERFLDMPVKHYSSGMQARLGFAVAAHLDQDILIIDEALAVGDAGFQRKCFDRMRQIAGAGSTILLVSHNMFAVERFCSRAILLVEGTVRDDGPPRRIIDQYLAEIELGVNDTGAPGDELTVGRVGIETDAAAGHLRGRITVTAQVSCRAEMDHLACGVGIYNSAAHLVANATADFRGLARGTHDLTIELANPGFAPGNYFLGFAAIRRERWIKLFERAASFRIPATVTDDPHMLDLLDLSGISLEVRRTTLDGRETA